MASEVRAAMVQTRWTGDKDSMIEIHEKCCDYGEDGSGPVNYVKGANIAGFVKVADAMLAYGAV